MRRLWRHALSWAVTLGMLLWVLDRVPWGDVWARAAGVWPAPIAAAAALSILGNAWFACQKYRLILRSLGTEMRLRDVILLKLGSAPLKGLLPLKSGEVVRLIYLQRTQGLSYVRGVVSVALNLGWTVLALGLIMLPGHLGQGAGPLGWYAGAGLVALLGSAIWLAGRNRAPGHRVRTVSWLPPEAWEIWRGLWGLGSGHTARILLFSLAFEGIKVLNYGLVFAAMGISVPWGDLFRIAPLLMLLSSLPVSIMGLGIREGGVMIAFSGAAADAHLVGAGMWISFLEAILPVLLGAILVKPFMGRLLDVRKIPAAAQGKGFVAR
jgi:hypothetical protein